MTRQRIRPFIPLVTGLTLFITLIFAASCSAPAAPAPQESAASAPPPREPYPESEIGCTPGPGYDGVERRPSGFWMENELIVTGPVEQLDDELRAALETTGFALELTLLEECPQPADAKSMGQAAEVLSSLTRRAITEDDLSQFVTRLYHYTGSERSTAEVAQTLMDYFLSSDANESLLLVDANYLTGLSGASSCANPFSVGDSPFSVGDSPFSVGDSPFSVGDSPYSGRGNNADPGAYRHQWALTQTVGVTPVIKSAGAGVRVYIFDTSPYPPTAVSESIMQEGMDFPLDLTLHAPIAVSSYGPVTPSQVVSGAADHGLFTAGLVHLVAPGSEIHLVRTLNDYGCGDLFTLEKALSWFLRTEGVDSDALDDVALNLSLGVNAPSDWLDGLLQAVWLRWNIEVIHAKGATIVAASGNDSGQVDLLASDPLSKLIPAQLPAGYPSVIGVAATNKARTRACYSNPGDVAAPGGDGYSGPGKKPNKPLKCVPYAGECSATDSGGACEYGLVSLVMTQTVTDTGFAYWAGTSFATPLVTGVAARKIGDKITQGAPIQDVMEEIKLDACPTGDQHLGDGIVSVNCP